MANEKDTEKSVMVISDNGQGNLPADPAAFAAAEKEKAVIQAAYIMAMRNPRDEDDAFQRLLKECRRPSFALQAEYAKPQGTSKVRGPTIRLIEAALRLWRNIASRTAVVYEDAEVRRIQVTVVDYETNTQHVKEIQVPKTVERKSPSGREVLGQRVNKAGEITYRVAATEDEVDQRTASLVSKVIRNEGRRLLPGDMIEEALETARVTCRDHDAKDPNDAKKRVLSAFATLNIMPSALSEYLGHDVGVATSPAELEDLRAVYQAIKDGETTWGEIIGLRKKQNADNTPGDGDPPPPVGATLADKIKAKAAAAEAAKAKAAAPTAPPVTPDPAPAAPPKAPEAVQENGKTAAQNQSEVAAAMAKINASRDRLAAEKAAQVTGKGYCATCHMNVSGPGLRPGAPCPTCDRPLTEQAPAAPPAPGRGARRMPAAKAAAGPTDEEKAMAVMKEAAAKDKAAREAAEAAKAPPAAEPQGSLLDVDDLDGTDPDAEEQAYLAALESEGK